MAHISLLLCVSVCGGCACKIVPAHKSLEYLQFSKSFFYFEDFSCNSFEMTHKMLILDAFPFDDVDAFNLRLNKHLNDDNNRIKLNAHQKRRYKTYNKTKLYIFVSIKFIKYTNRTVCKRLFKTAVTLDYNENWYGVCGMWHNSL